MKPEKYVELDELVAILKELCTGISNGAKELAKGVEAFREGLQKRPFFTRSFATRDFESGTGLKADEWIDFAERLSNRFQSIAAKLQEAQEHLSKSEFDRISRDLDNLKAVAEPFMNNYDLIIDTLNRFHTYMAEAPERAKSIPKIFLSEEDRKMMVEELPKTAEGIKKLSRALGEAKTKIQEAWNR